MPSINGPGEVGFNIAPFPKYLRQQMKSLSAAEGTSLREAVIQACEDWCEKAEHRQQQAREVREAMLQDKAGLRPRPR